MPSYEASAVTKASAEAAWSAWTDVQGWSAYDHIEAARVDGDFQPGAAITSKAKGFPSSTLTVTRVEPPGLWVDESRSPGMRMTFDHVLEPGEGGTRLTERVHISGPLGRALGPLMRRKLVALFADSVAAVARQAEAAEAQAEPPTS
jgi:Polyketide cyclase / dehydrase and lipid transport